MVVQQLVAVGVLHRVMRVFHSVTPNILSYLEERQIFFSKDNPRSDSRDITLPAKLCIVVLYFLVVMY